MIRKALFSLTLSFVALTLFGQAETANYKVIADKFEIFYNKEQYDSIFALFTAEMKSALPLDKTKGFLTTLKSQVGSITKRQFTKYQTTYAVYKTTFDAGLFAVLISVDGTKINGLFVKPFVDESGPKLERNTTPLKLPFKGEWTVFWGGDTKELNY